MSIVKAENIFKSYETDGTVTEVLKGISLTIEEGSFISIMGQSGSGKSTLLYVLSGLDRPTSGKVLFGDHELSHMIDQRLSQVRRRDFGFVFQFYNLIPTLTVAENIALPLELDNIRKKSYMERLDSILEKVGLADRRKHFPYQLSGGQQQRAAIARALITDPKIIFADEPTGNLDSASGEAVLELLARLSREEGKSVLMVTHDSHGASYSDLVINIKDGQIVK